MVTEVIDEYEVLRMEATAAISHFIAQDAMYQLTAAGSSLCLAVQPSPLCRSSIHHCKEIRIGSDDSSSHTGLSPTSRSDIPDSTLRLRRRADILFQSTLAYHKLRSGSTMLYSNLIHHLDARKSLLHIIRSYSFNS